MRLKSHIRRAIAIWLSAILVLLSLAASAHSVTHLDDGATSHCTLCFHQHQLNKMLPLQPLYLKSDGQQFERLSFSLPSYVSQHSSCYHSRAPPVFV
ncbi:ABC-type zinc uptake system zinc chaperone [Shewanella sp. AS16]|uniref:ABC-type zinc uptake system zinc chaperone n=1 Tax=Shewanella sp. AS16 TaxID=2907625 RepID=UPI001F483228|nr:ABC-type zinc uptake system zinc chaperone [Shewanella sp. AS16]MCE9685854.1 ABC-type zinc uptake system zinc chaperone [Shewanella sp. AS16]